MSYDAIFLNGVTVIAPDSGDVKYQGGSAVLELPAHLVRAAHGEHYHQELQYLALLKELVNKAEGDVREDRTGTGTYSVFGRQMRFDLSTGEFPLLTTKSVHFKSVLAELRWMLRGDTNIKDLDASIWDEWADQNGCLGPVYGKQWRAWEGAQGHIDQIANVIEEIQNNPGSRRLVVSAWNVADLPRMALAPCHCLFQFYVEDDLLHLQLYQRSADIFLGVPFNVASYAMLLKLVAETCGLRAGEFVHTFGDLHLYSNHVEQAREQLSRTPLPLPELILQPGTDLFDLKPENVVLSGYNPHPAIKAEVSV